MDLLKEEASLITDGVIEPRAPSIYSNGSKPLLKIGGEQHGLVINRIFDGALRRDEKEFKMLLQKFQGRLHDIPIQAVLHLFTERSLYTFRNVPESKRNGIQKRINTILQKTVDTLLEAFTEEVFRDDVSVASNLDFHQIMVNSDPFLHALYSATQNKDLVDDLMVLVSAKELKSTNTVTLSFTNRNKSSKVDANARRRLFISHVLKTLKEKRPTHRMVVNLSHEQIDDYFSTIKKKPPSRAAKTQGQKQSQNMIESGQAVGKTSFSRPRRSSSSKSSPAQDSPAPPPPAQQTKPNNAGIAAKEVVPPLIKDVAAAAEEPRISRALLNAAEEVFASRNQTENAENATVGQQAAVVELAPGTMLKPWGVAAAQHTVKTVDSTLKSSKQQSSKKKKAACDSSSIDDIIRKYKKVACTSVISDIEEVFLKPQPKLELNKSSSPKRRDIIALQLEQARKLAQILEFEQRQAQASVDALLAELEKEEEEEKDQGDEEGSNICLLIYLFF